MNLTSLFPKYEMFLNQSPIFFFCLLCSSFGFSWVPCSTGAGLNIKSAVSPQSHLPHGLWIWCWDCSFLIVHVCPQEPVFSLQLPSQWVWIPLGSLAPGILSICVFTLGFCNIFMDCKRGGIWKVDNNVSHPCLVFVWGCKDIHRSLCYPTQPSLCLDSKSACICHCFLTDIFNDFHSSQCRQCGRTKEKVPKYIFCLLFCGDSGDSFNATLVSCHSPGQHPILS